MRHLFGCPDIVSLTEKFVMARIFFRIFTENNPVMGYSKTFFIPEAKGLKGQYRHDQQGHGIGVLVLDNSVTENNTHMIRWGHITFAAAQICE